MSSKGHCVRVTQRRSCSRCAELRQEVQLLSPPQATTASAANATSIATPSSVTDVSPSLIRRVSYSDGDELEQVLQYDATADAAEVDTENAMKVTSNSEATSSGHYQGPRGISSVVMTTKAPVRKVQASQQAQANESPQPSPMHTTTTATTTVDMQELLPGRHRRGMAASSMHVRRLEQSRRRRVADGAQHQHQQQEGTAVGVNLVQRKKKKKKNKGPPSTTMEVDSGAISFKSGASLSLLASSSSLPPAPPSSPPLLRVCQPAMHVCKE